jgi:peroxiredoxin
LQNGSTAVVTDVGERVRDFTLPDSTGASHSLSSLVAASPLVLLFFRGHW